MRVPWIAALLLASCAGSSAAQGLPTIAPSGAREEIPMEVRRPAGPGPFPAVVILHDCSGLGPRSSGAPGRWAAELVAQGYVTVMPDSFSTRGFPSGVCVEGATSRNDVSPARRVLDAYAALAQLRTLPYVDGRRVGVMGGSHGGSTTLAAMASPETDRNPFVPDRRDGFAAGVSLYPGCAGRASGWRGARTGGISVPAGEPYLPMAPLLILIGDKDDWTPAEPCRRLVAASQAAGAPVSIKVYPDAHHSFDSANPVRFLPGRINANSPTGRGATTGGNPEAWQDAIREVRAFFARHLAVR